MGKSIAIISISWWCSHVNTNKQKHEYSSWSIPGLHLLHTCHSVHSVGLGKIHILRYVKLQRAHVKIHTKFWTHTPQNTPFTDFNVCVWFTITLNYDVKSLSENVSWYISVISLIFNDNICKLFNTQPVYPCCVVLWRSTVNGQRTRKGTPDKSCCLYKTICYTIFAFISNIFYIRAIVN